MIRRPPRSTLDRSSAASDVYKRQLGLRAVGVVGSSKKVQTAQNLGAALVIDKSTQDPVSYTHLRAHETVLDLVCRLLLEKKNLIHPTTLTCYSATILSTHTPCQFGHAIRLRSSADLYTGR